VAELVKHNEHAEDDEKRQQFLQDVHHGSRQQASAGSLSQARATARASASAAERVIEDTHGTRRHLRERLRARGAMSV
jgi:hypothetical protein